MNLSESSFLFDKIDQNPADPQVQYYNVQVNTFE